MTILYVFSGTGNSLAVARELADHLDAEIRSIPALMRQASVGIEADVVGFVFPVHHKSIPLILRRFVEKARFKDDAYLFALCTYGDSPGLAVDHLRELLTTQGKDLAAGFGVHLPYNYLTPSPVLRGFFRSFTLREIPKPTLQALVAAAPEKIAGVVAAIRVRETGLYERTSDLITPFAERIGLPETLGKWVWMRVAGVHDPPDVPFLESRQVMDQAFWADPSCNGCGICAQICPVRNVDLVDDRPRWLGHCEQCFACLQWCPQEAIQFGRKTTGRRRYHHPSVTLAEMLRLAPKDQDWNQTPQS